MKVRLGVPAYGGVLPETVKSLILTYHGLYLAGHEVEIDLVSGGSVLPKVRNEITQRFFDAEEDVLVFLDSDMAWDAIDVLRLILADLDVVCGNYRVKSDEDKWVCYLEPDEDGYPTLDGDGNIKVTDAGTGFLAIKRDIIRKMRESYPQLHYTDKDDGPMFCAFDFELAGGKYWGEDYTFCKRWRDIGGEIWMIPDCTIHHIGQKEYTGNYHEYLLERGRKGL